MPDAPRSNDSQDDLQTLLSTLAGPWVVRIPELNESFKRTVKDWERSAPGYRCIELDGRRMRTKNSSHNELIRKLSLPDYYGRNLDALNDCMTDEDVMVGTGFFILIVNGDSMLSWSLSSRSALGGLLSTFEGVATSWSVPINEGECWDRPAYPFHVGIHATNRAPRPLLELPVVTARPLSVREF